MLTVGKAKLSIKWQSSIPLQQLSASHTYTYINYNINEQAQLNPSA